MGKKVTKTDLIFDQDRITLKSVYDKASITYFISPCKNKNGQYPKCIKRVNANGDMILSEQERNEYSEGKLALFPENHVFEVTSGKTYNLKDIWEAAEWEAIKNCPYIALSRDQRDVNGNLVIDGAISTPSKPSRNGVAELYVEHPGLDAKRRVSKKQKIHQAYSFIFDDPKGIDGQLNMAKILGKDMRNQPTADVVDYLTRIADKDPQKIIDLYTGQGTELRILFIDAKEKKIIISKNKLYIYGDNIVLGATDDAVIAWMQDPRNQKILELIKKDTYPDYYENIVDDSTK
jgi:hypothetical protein